MRIKKERSSLLLLVTFDQICNRMIPPISSVLNSILVLPFPKRRVSEGQDGGC